jgi:hypothetical protein
MAQSNDGWLQLKEVASLPRHFENGAILIEVHHDGIRITGFRDLDPVEGAATFVSRIFLWPELEQFASRPLCHYHAALVRRLGLVEKEASDAGG